MSQSTKRDYYEVLGIGRDADEAAIKKAFRRLARELHPDVNPDDPTAEERFKEAAEAHEVLSDPDRRRVYDQHGHEGLRGGGYQPGFEGFGSFSDLFSAFFGGGGSSRRGGGPMEGEDVAVQLAVSLEEAARGAEKTVTFEQVVTCERCHGNQAEPGTPIESCQRCNGQGQLQAVQRTPFGQVVRTVLCDVCDGEGKTPKTPCTQCQGRGRLVDETELTVDVPAGIADGQRMRLAGRGHAGERGGPAGDLYVLLRVRSDPRFVRDGDDLVTALDVPAPLAALGSTLDVETLLDGRVPVEVPAGTQPGEVLKLQGQGMPSLRGGRRGDLRVVANVTVPKRLTPEQRDLLERFAASLTESNAHDRGEGVVGKLRRLLHRD